MARRLRRRIRLAAAQRAAQHGRRRDVGVAAPRRRRGHRLFAARRRGDRLRRHAARRRSGSSACCGTIRRRASCAMPMPAIRRRSTSRKRTAWTCRCSGADRQQTAGPLQAARRESRTQRVNRRCRRRRFRDRAPCRAHRGFRRLAPSMYARSRRRRRCGSPATISAKPAAPGSIPCVGRATLATLGTSRLAAVNVPVTVAVSPPTGACGQAGGTGTPAGRREVGAKEQHDPAAQSGPSEMDVRLQHVRRQVAIVEHILDFRAVLVDFRCELAAAGRVDCDRRLLIAVQGRRKRRLAAVCRREGRCACGEYGSCCNGKHAVSHFDPPVSCCGYDGVDVNRRGRRLRARRKTRQKRKQRCG